MPTSLPSPKVVAIEDTARAGASSHGRGVVLCIDRGEISPLELSYIPQTQWERDPIPGFEDDPEIMLWLRTYVISTEYLLIYVDATQGDEAAAEPLRCLYQSPIRTPLSA